MGIFDYEVIQIDGDYAHLRNLDRPEDELKPVSYTHLDVYKRQPLQQYFRWNDGCSVQGQWLY